MKIRSAFLVVVLSILFFGFQFITEDHNNWPNWRGPNSDGVSLNGTPPTKWSETNNIKWKKAIPGKGIGTPVVWGDQIFVTTAIELDKKATEEAIKKLKETSPNFVKLMGWRGTTENFLQFVVYSINRSTGEIIWEKVVREQFPHENIHNEGSWASASCVTDGKYLIASFGSYGIYCFDMTGNLIWEKDFGDMQVESAFGEGASPVMYKDRVIIAWDHEGQSKVYALNKETGEEIWQKERDEGTTWATPIVVEFDGENQIVISGENYSRGYNFKNGNLIWKIGGLGDGVIPSPVFDGERTYLMSGYGKTKIIQAIDLQRATENTDAIVWSIDKISSYVPSPLMYNGKLYFLKSINSQLSCVNAKTGEVYYNAQKIPGLRSVYASPIYANGKIYIMDRNGTCAVIKEGSEFNVISQNTLEDNFDASPVVIGDQLLLRGHKSLYCISK